MKSSLFRLLAQASVALLLLSAPFRAAAAEAPQAPRGIVNAIGNAAVQETPAGLRLTRATSAEPVTIACTGCQGVALLRRDGQWWVLPTDFAQAAVEANAAMWLLPADPLSHEHAWRVPLQGAFATVRKTPQGLQVSISGAAELKMESFEARPHSDPFGKRFRLQIRDGAALEDALAAFYWGTMLPSVVEKTLASKFPYSDGYVLSTLNTASYAGSYPAVDHEFQIRGRIAMGSDLDLDVVRRMIELQFRLMADDPEHLYRSPTSVQPDGRREYHIRRDSKDARENAAMFPLTGNIEVLEESWLYYKARKDRAWLERNIVNLEHAAGWTLASMDQYGRVWSDVYYEDQVIKDGRETEAQAFAAGSFEDLAVMERVLGRAAEAATYDSASKRARAALVEPRPMGFWDASANRFVDWVDRNGTSHEHTALLGNTLPVTLGYAGTVQAAAVHTLVDANRAEFQRFPSFVAADIAAYTASEMGVAGPYDLSAAARYWYWDAAYLASQNQNAEILQQLAAVASEGRNSAYWMGERYDMDHVYYRDGKNAHGAEKYYEYPNVFAAVLLGDALGLGLPADADVAVRPRLTAPGTVEIGTAAYALRYAVTATAFKLTNLAAKPRTFLVDMSALAPAGSGTQPRRPPVRAVLGPGERRSWKL